MNPKWIPCMTGRTESEYNIHLISPSSRNPFVKAKKQTIVDCLTYGLRLNKKLDPFKHYLWYIDFVKEHENDDELVFIVPDCDWLGGVKTSKIADKWLATITTDKCLKIPGTFLFDKVTCIGYALAVHQSGPVHPRWTHSFSKFFKPVNVMPKRWTYDSLAEKEY